MKPQIDQNNKRSLNTAKKLIFLFKQHNTNVYVSEKMFKVNTVYVEICLIFPNFSILSVYVILDICFF